MEDPKKCEAENNESKEHASDDVEMHEEKEENDPFALLHETFTANTKPGLLQERASILSLIDSISSELQTNKSKILER
jgi:hypothetical protein|tara:strand:+ start:29 stop:262 length:234 start_codon:yes stop_codon:yes gene_type:complete